MTTALWGGRFEYGLSDVAKQLSFSVHIDRRLVHEDIRVNKAHANALMHANVLTQTENQSIQSCLDDIDQQFRMNHDLTVETDEDIHSCIERLVTEKLGDLGKKLHTGKSRNDQVITDSRLFIKSACQDIESRILGVIQSLIQFATTYQTTVFPGMTHFQPAQPVLFAHYMLAYVEKLSRDAKRFRQAYHTADVCSLGSAAMAGNSYGLDRHAIATELGFAHVSQNSMDAVSDRDFMLEFLAAASFCMTHLTRFCEEIVIWNSPLVGFINIGDAFTTGSSIMPQKKNPDMAELIRGKSARVLGHLTAMQHLLKSLPLTYNRDLQEDKCMIFDATDTLMDVLSCLQAMIPTMTLNHDQITAALTIGHLTATELADYLVRQGVPFRESHEMTGKIVNFAVSINTQLQDLSLDQYQQFSPKITASVFDAVSLKSAIATKDSIGGTAQSQVDAQLKRVSAQFNTNHSGTESTP